MLAALILSSVLLKGDPTGYPSTTTKKELYAGNDLRGKPAPKLVVEQWLTGAAPSTKGKTVIVDYWATWCPACRESIPELNQFAQKFPKDVVVIGVSDEDPAVVTKFMKTTPMKYNVAIDRKSRDHKAIDIQAIPHVLVISPDGIVRWQGFPLDSTEPLTAATVGQIVAASKK